MAIIQNSVFLKGGKKVLHNRYVKTTPDYTGPTKFAVGVNSDTPLRGDTDLYQRIPITSPSVVDACTGVFVASALATDDSTDNTTLFKSFAGKTDDTAQNIFCGATADKIKYWTKVTDSVMDETKYLGFWTYFSSQEVIDGFEKLRIGVSASGDPDRYYKDISASDFAVGWKFYSLGVINTWSYTTVPVAFEQLWIEFYAVSAATSWSEGSVVLDGFIQWSLSDTLKTLDSAVPDESNEEVVIEGKLGATDCEGFFIDGFCVFNGDSSPIALSLDVFDGKSKSADDIFIFSDTER